MCVLGWDGKCIFFYSGVRLTKQSLKASSQIGKVRHPKHRKRRPRDVAENSHGPGKAASPLTGCATCVCPAGHAASLSLGFPSGKRESAHLPLCLGEAPKRQWAYSVQFRVWCTVGVQCTCAPDLLEPSRSGFSLPIVRHQTLTYDQTGPQHTEYEKHPAPV